MLAQAISVLKTVIARAWSTSFFCIPGETFHGSRGTSLRGGSKFSEVTFLPRRSGQRVRQPPSAKPRQVHAGQEVKSSRKPVPLVNPDSSREAARLKVVKLEKALEVMGDSEGAAVECMKLELEKARNAETRRPINVQVEECRKFIIWLEKCISELDAERESEVMALDEAKERLLRLEAEQAAVPSEDPANIPIPLVWQTQVDALKAQLASLEEERDRVRAASCKRHAVGHGQTYGVIPPMKQRIPGEQMAEGAEHLVRMTGSAMVS